MVRWFRLRVWSEYYTGDEDWDIASFGKTDEFIPSKESWGEYEERLEYYFVANDVVYVDAGKKKAMLITSIGSSNHSLLRSIVAPGKLADN